MPIVIVIVSAWVWLFAMLFAVVGIPTFPHVSIVPAELVSE